MTYTFVIPGWIVLFFCFIELLGAAVKWRHTYWVRRLYAAEEEGRRLDAELARLKETRPTESRKVNGDDEA